MPYAVPSAAEELSCPAFNKVAREKNTMFGSSTATRRPSFFVALLGALALASLAAVFTSLPISIPYHDVIRTRSVAVLPEYYITNPARVDSNSIPCRDGFFTPVQVSSDYLLGFEYKHNNDWRYQYMDVVPSPDQAWPVQAAVLLVDPNHPHQHLRNSTTARHTLTTCVPTLFRDIETNLPPLLGSIAAQTVPADEVIIVVSDVPSSDSRDSSTQNASDWKGVSLVGAQICQNMHQHLIESLQSHTANDDYHPSPVLRLVCVGERLTAGRARNVAGQLAGGSIVSFVDSDDVEYPERNQVVLNVFECHRNLRLLLHSSQRRNTTHKTVIQQQNMNSCPYEANNGIGAVHGVELYDILQKTHRRLWMRADIAHGHIVVHKSILRHVHFSSMYKGQDSLMIRDILYQYGRNDEAAIFIKLPLTSYFKASHANKDLV